MVRLYKQKLKNRSVYNDFVGNLSDNNFDVSSIETNILDISQNLNGDCVCETVQASDSTVDPLVNNGHVLVEEYPSIEDKFLFVQDAPVPDIIQKTAEGPQILNQSFDFLESEQPENSVKEINDTDFNPEENSGSSSSSEDDEISSEDLMSNEDIRRVEALREERQNRTGRPKKGRHTKYPGQSFSTRKKLKDSNLKHYTIKGKLKESKKFIDFHCNCPKKCNENVSVETREKLFKQFWNLASYDSQTGFIASTVKEFSVKRKRSEPNRKSKSFSRTYFLSNIEVCRTAFINTYQISTKRVNTSLTKLREGRLKDERGNIRGDKIGKKKIDPETINRIIEQIKRFPTYVSHYTRGQTDAKFLSYDLTEAKMYELYLEDENNPKVSFTFYKKTFYENFNLRRKPAIKDTCNKCDAFSAKIKSVSHDTKEQLEAAHEEHLANAKLARTSMQNDMKEASTNPLLETLCYDMEKVLGLPKLPTNLVYYKRQLSIYNEGVHTGSTNKPYAFIWKEGVAGRGAQEVGSCLKKFIDLRLKEGVQDLILWSDSCGGQNRNIKIVLMLKKVLSEHPTLQTIYFKYLESGHSFLPNDTDFAQIERALKLQVRIYTLDEFKSIIEKSKKHNPFEVIDMNSEDFFSTQDIEKQITNRKISIDKNKVSWLKTKVIKIEKDKAFSIFLKESHAPEEQYHEINISKISRGRKGAKDFSSLTPLYPDGKEISNKKAADLKTLMRFIPLDARPFFKIGNLQEFDDDIDGFGENLDFEIEEVLNE